ncbi:MULTISPECIES: ATP-binding protein [unclassified Salinivibrio]|uniref:PAS domain-containing sensor histidine kinase n=1 Tax=unclassified Salinivibrio TaxID=2636825 RepID=UPI00128E2AD5|nr:MULTISPECIES: ATP-binding protein [unclassified Salinivibrio]MPS31391.1 ATP-binding protein [Salinivibrio sp. VYel7]MPX90490.1 ATP-binding protein [Salinivibrio sp. VYel1]MPX92788.1 ATP-binding protein [Salinivibrio sp. VYel9]MPX95528.1 ATP-binding protein [Salinivibrio sp. VYel6]MPX99006.1 ATP-binding protein [Salinivibrio sp. VYel4]
MEKLERFEQGLKHPLFSIVGRRIILLMVLLSGFFTILTTLLQLSWDYEEAFDHVDRRHAEIQNVHADLIASSLWVFDLVSAQNRLDGLVNLPYIDYLSIEFDGVVLDAGKPLSSSNVVSQTELIYFHPDTNRRINLGTLRVESDAQKIYDLLLQQFLVTLVLNGIKTLIVCSLILWVFHQSVSQRVFAITKHLASFDPLEPVHEPLRLKHRKFIMEKSDELDWLADETNKITLRMTSLYRNIALEQARLSDFTNAASDWLWETDATQRLTFCSEAMQAALAISIENNPKIKSVPALSHCTSLLNCLDTYDDFTMCEEKITLGKHTYYFVFQGIAHFTKHGFTGFRGTAIDITELKTTQLELEQLNQSLEATVEARTQDLAQSMENLKAAQNQLVESEKLAALGSLVAGVAHEVNTPLGIAVTANSVIKDAVSTLNRAFEQKTLTSEQYATVMKQVTDGTHMLENNLNRAARLIRDFKQTAVDQVSENLSQFRPVQTLEALMGSLRPETKKVPVVPIVEGDAKLVMSSLPGVLTQVISNLVINSVRHAFDTVNDPRIHIRIADKGEIVEIRYTDNGVGVAPELHQRIFEPFYTSSRGKGGSGLGLNLVFNLVHQKLQGKLHFDSNINQGVTVVLSLPKFLTETSAPQTESSTE